MSDVSYKEITAEEDGQRLDNYLIRVLKGVPKSHIYRIIRGGEVRVNKKRCQVNQRLQTGDILRIPPIRLAAHKDSRHARYATRHKRRGHFLGAATRSS